jgi:hypothetical protein
VARNADKTSKAKPGDKPGGPDDDQDSDRVLPTDAEPEADGYMPTRRQVARGDKPEGGKGKSAPAGPPPTKYQQFMEQHWEGWLSQVLLILLLGAGVIGYKMDLLRESMIGILLSGGLVASAIYVTAIPAYDLIKNSTGRRLFAALVVLWVIAAGYPTLRKGMSRKVLAETVLTEESKTVKLPVAEGQVGPYDVTISGSLKPDAAQSSNIGYELVVAGEGGIRTEVSGEFTYAVHQARVRRGSTHWTEQHNQIEHRLPRALRGSELTISTDRVEDTLQDGLHVTVHPQSYDPNWFFVAGIFVVFAMIYVESRIGDSKTKPHLIMASATTLVFSYWYHLHATSNRMVAPTLDALILAVITGGIGGTIVGAIVRRASGRDRLKPALEDEKSEKASEPA